MSSKGTKSVPESTNLTNILNDLNTSTERAMVSLYNLEVATINANGENPPRHSERYKEIRVKLKEQWEAIIGVLKKCHSFGADVVLLKQHMASASKEDLEDLIQEMAAKCKRCMNTTEQLANGHSSVVAVYFQHEPRFKGSLQNPKVVIDPTQVYGNPYQDNASAPPQQSPSRSRTHEAKAPYAAYTRTPQPGARRKPFNPMAEFIDDNIKSLYPDGNEAIKGFIASAQKIHQQLEAFTFFLQTQYQVCDQCLDGLKKPSMALKPKDVQSLATQWTAYQAEIMKSITSITKVCDAIMVEAVAAAPPSPPQAPPRMLGYVQESHATGQGHRNTAIGGAQPTPPRYGPMDPRGWMPEVNVNFNILGGGGGGGNQQQQPNHRGRWY